MRGSTRNPGGKRAKTGALLQVGLVTGPNGSSTFGLPGGEECEVPQETQEGNGPRAKGNRSQAATVELFEQDPEGDVRLIGASYRPKR